MIYVVVLHPETDLLHEEIMRVMHEELFQVVRIEIEWTEMQEEIISLHHADVHPQEIEGDHHMQTWNCLQEDKIDQGTLDTFPLLQGFLQCSCLPKGDCSQVTPKSKSTIK